MAASVIEGTLVEANVRRTAKAVTMYQSLKFRLRDGGSHDIVNAVASGDVVQHLKPGTEGRFYLFSAIDMRGVYGVRLAGGQSASDYPGKSNRAIFLLALGAGLAIFLLYLLATGSVRLFPLVPLAIGAFGLIYMAKIERGARELFESEA